MSTKMIKKNVLYSLGLFLYRITLDFVYIKYISPQYAYYMGLKTDIHIENVIVSFLLTIVAVLLTPHNKEHLSDVLMNVQLVVMLMPMLSLCALSGRSIVFMLVVCIAYVLQCMIVLLSHRIKNRRQHIELRQSKIWEYALLASLLVVAVMYTFSQYGMGTLKAFDFTQVYDIRANVSYGFPFSYILPWTFKIVCIYIFLLGLEHKKYFMVLLASGAQIYFYLVYANKSTLFSWVLVLGSYIIVKRMNVIKVMIVGLIVLLIGSSAVYVFTGNIMILSLLVRRTFFVPARIKFAYYEFFSENSLLHFADNSIGHLLGIDSPYELQAPKLIAEYLNEPQSYCNSGYWGDAYANFGFAGVIIFSLIFVVIILMIENMDIPKTIAYPFLISLVYNLNDGALLTWILGGGGALAIVLLWLYRNYLRREYSGCLVRNSEYEKGRFREKFRF